ncbi:MAG: YitT family protein [Candidatus Cloacimonetes bacterium]|nr:YitT family protein [Candidatus Cloacimonadota bacterium]
MKHLNKHLFIDILGIIFGTALCGFAFSLFLIPFKSSPGGVGGLAQILYYVFQLPAGISMLMINIPLFIIGVLAFGKMFGMKTIIAMLSLTFFTDLFSAKVLLQSETIKAFLFQINDTAWSFTNETFLAVLAGSVIVGAGFGIVIKFNGSTGGSDIPALLMRKHFGFTIGNSYLIIDTVVIFIVGIIFGDPNLILWGMLSLFVSSKICDFVLEGYSYAKGVLVITNYSKVISQAIMTDMNRGCTIFYGKGAYSNKDQEMVYTVISRRELSKLKSIIHSIDNNAFVTIADVHETLGTGFKDF